MITVLAHPRVQVFVVTVRPEHCRHRRVRHVREYRGVHFYRCTGCAREFRQQAARA